jgi:hypothetical protein
MEFEGAIVKAWGECHIRFHASRVFISVILDVAASTLSSFQDPGKVISGILTNAPPTPSLRFLSILNIAENGRRNQRHH